MKKMLLLFILVIQLIGNLTWINAYAQEPFTEENIEKFAQTYFSEESLKAQHITSAVFTVVSKDEVLYNQGFGFSNLEKNVPVNLDETNFRVGSVGKLLVGIAVAQLVEDGKVDLERNVNEYLTEFQIPDTYDTPITLKHLVTHTAGFDEELLTTFREDYKTEVDLATFIKENIPSRVREPGVDYQYDNFGVTLAAHIVEMISGMPFHEYVQKNIFQPLNMTSSFAMLTEEALPNLAKEYEYKNGQYKPLPLYGVNVYPAGGMVATPNDMGRFLMAHLNEARGEANILFDSDEKIMYETMETPHPSVSGLGMNFHEYFYGDNRFLTHKGDTFATHSYFMISPKQDVGVYFSFIGGSGYVTHQIIQDFYKAFFPLSIPTVAKVDETFEIPLEKFEGAYNHNRYSKDSFIKFSWLTTPQAKVEATKNGLSLKFIEEETFTRVEEYLFQNKKGQHLMFKTDSNGEIRAFSFDHNVFDRSPWYHFSADHIGLLLGIIGLFVISIVFYLVRVFQNRRKSLKVGLNDHLLLLAALFHLLFVGGFTYVFSTMSVTEIIFTIPFVLKLSMILPILAFVFTLGLGGKLIWDWVKGKSTLFYSIYNLIFILGSMIFTFILHYYRLIGFYY